MGEGRIRLLGSEPIFPVADVCATVRYYHDVLGFADTWLWGEPPDFGGARWGKIGVMFAQQSGSDSKIGGQCHSFFVHGIDSLYELHKSKGATISATLEAKPWGLREYTVRDLNGHYLRFGQRNTARSATAGREPAKTVEIVERLPNDEEHMDLMRAVGWANIESPDRVRKGLAGARFGVVAMELDHVVGTGLVIGDGAAFCYLKDIVVRPEWQGRGIGSRIVEALLGIIHRTATERMFVTLFTGQHLAEFYEQFGFSGPEQGLYGMSLTMDPKDRESET